MSTGWDDVTRAGSSGPLILRQGGRLRFLVCQTGSRRGEWLPLVHARTVLGRGQSATMRFDEDSVSREHAEILIDGDAITLVDLGSRNGTFCNGARVARHALLEGDRIILGKKLTLSFVERAAEDGAPPIGLPPAEDLTPSPVPADARTLREVGAVQRIQSRLLPDRVDVEGMQLAARMLPSDEVGGDYYEVLPTEGGCWLGIGDVAGHGLQPGLIMLMIQSCIAACVRQTPNAAPADLVQAANDVLYANIRERAGQDEHASLAMLRYRNDGLVRFAGAHEEVIVWRATTGRCERYETTGAFLGASRNIDELAETTVRLSPGDLLVLYTDGIIEGRNAGRTQFGVERLCAAIEATGGGAGRTALAIESIRDQVLERVLDFTGGHREDDMTLLVGRYDGVGCL